MTEVSPPSSTGPVDALQLRAGGGEILATAETIAEAADVSSSAERTAATKGVSAPVSVAEIAPDGLIDIVLGRRVTTGGRVERITAMLWRDQEALFAGLGPDWDRPTCMIRSATPVLEDHRIEHFEVLADDWPKMIHVLETQRPREPPLSH